MQRNCKTTEKGAPVSRKNRIRIFVDVPLKTGLDTVCSDAVRHYLIDVMRQNSGDTVYVFNGRDGEFAAVVQNRGKKECVLQTGEMFCPYKAAPDVWLLFAPLKKDRTELVIEKAVELGASRLIPVRTAWTGEMRVRADRMQSRVIEAAEQSRRQDLPAIDEQTDLETLLKNWPKERKLIFMDESGQSKSAAAVMPLCQAPAAVLVGPEGGFTQKELEILRNLPYTYGVSLGTRILRAETAAAAALACWQAFCGDWNEQGADNEDSDSR
jgi:16S rRNA (uracil1498-N3)-methyltransferase